MGNTRSYSRRRVQRLFQWLKAFGSGEIEADEIGLVLDGYELEEVVGAMNDFSDCWGEEVPWAVIKTSHLSIHKHGRYFEAIDGK